MEDFKIVDDVLKKYRGPGGDVALPDGVKEIGDWAFFGCTTLLSLVIPRGAERIGGWAFQGCSSLESVSIPEGVESIGISAFDGCASLGSICIPDSVSSIHGWAFNGCTSLAIVRGGGIPFCREGNIGHVFNNVRPAIWCGLPFETLSGSIAKACHAYGYACCASGGEEIEDTLAGPYRTFIAKSFETFAKEVGAKLFGDVETLSWLAAEGLIPKKEVAGIASELSTRGYVEAAAIVLDSASGRLAGGRKSKGLEL